MNTVKQFQSLINKTKNKLIKKVERKGIYENFGQNEIHKLSDCINSSCYTDEENTKRNMLQGFNNWCMNYNE